MGKEIGKVNPGRKRTRLPGSILPAVILSQSGMASVPGSMVCGFDGRLAQSIEDQQCSAGTDGRVGNIERRKIVAAGVELDEIDDVAQYDAVVKVAHGAAENQRQRQAQQTILRMPAHQPREKNGNH